MNVTLKPDLKPQPNLGSKAGHDPVANPVSNPVFDPVRAYRLVEGAVVRPERFGALIYHRPTRKLCFVHCQGVSALIRGLDGSQPMAMKVDEFLVEQGLPASAREPVLRSLARLQSLQLIVAA